MDKDINEIFNEFFDFENEREYHFKTLYGFTFVFQSEITFINNSISSASITPLAIIYEENGQYYLAPLSGVDEIEEVVKEFVEKKII